jgi:hypothetical protein
MLDDVVDEFYEEVVEKGKKSTIFRQMTRFLKKDYPKSPNDVANAIDLLTFLNFFDNMIFPDRNLRITFTPEKSKESFLSYYSPYTNPIRGDSYLIRVSNISNKIEDFRAKTLVPLLGENGKRIETRGQSIYFPSAKAIITMSAINAVRQRVQHIARTNIFSPKKSHRNPQINEYVKYINILSDSNRFLLAYPENKRPLEFDAKLIELLSINQIINCATESEVCNIIGLEGDMPMRWYIKDV